MKKRERITYTLNEIRDEIASGSRCGHPDEYIPYTARPRLRRTPDGWVLELSWVEGVDR